MHLLAQSNITFKPHNTPIEGLAFAGTAFAIFGLIITAIVHITFALSIYQDAARMNANPKNSTVFAGEFIWAIWVLITGPFGAGLYWAIHHSTLRLQETKAGA